MTENSPEAASVLGSVQGFSWSSEESVAYEAAIEAINGVVGACSARIAAEKKKPAPDAEAIARWTAERAACAREREQLDPTNHEQIAQARQQYRARRDEIRAAAE